MLRFAAVFLLMPVASFAAAQAPVVPGARLTTPPKIDGVIEDAEWKNAPSFEGLVDATTGGPSPEPGKFWLAYDDKYIYFAARLTDSQPGGIRATEYRTNVSMPGDDVVALDLDLSGSLSDFSSFMANARGATNITLAGGRAVKREWTGEIQAQGRITTTGWEEEMRIPWSILPIPRGGVRDVRFNVTRYIARLSRSFTHSFTDSGQFQQRTPIWRSVTLPKPYVDRSLLLLPYAYAGASENRGAILNAGVDMKTNLADQVHLVGSISPDFRNIETSILSLDFSRFARIANENRPFFQEGSEYYNSAIFASQLIRRFDVGLNAYGKLNDKVQFGVLDTNDFGDDNALVGNFTYAPNADTNYRVTMTQRDMPGAHNSAYLARLSQNFGPWNLFLRDMGSQDTARGWGENSSASLGYAKSGLFAFGSYTRVTPDFSPALGFFPEVDYQGWDLGGFYQHPLNHGPLRQVSLNTSGTVYDRTSGKFYRNEINVQPGIVTRSDISLSGFVDFQDFEGSKDHTAGAFVSFPNSNPYRHGSIGYTGGEIDSQPYRLLTANGQYRLFRRLQLTGSFQKFQLGSDEREQTIFGGNYDLGGDRSISGRLVRTGDDTNWYAAFRRSGNRGAEYYLIVGDPSALRWHPSVILKVVVPFRM